jgi:hypothetical protein
MSEKKNASHDKKRVVCKYLKMESNLYSQQEKKSMWFKPQWCLKHNNRTFLNTAAAWNFILDPHSLALVVWKEQC